MGWGVFVCFVFLYSMRLLVRGFFVFLHFVDKEGRFVVFLYI